MDAKTNGKPLTGRMVLIYALSAFGVIIAANLALAVAAVGSFPGIEVKNGYVASQKFEAERAAQAQLGWSASAAYVEGRLTVSVVDRSGGAVELDRFAMRLGRPTTEAQDVSPTVDWTSNGYVAELNLAPGLWRIDVVAESVEGDPFRQHLVIEVAG